MQRGDLAVTAPFRYASVNETKCIEIRSDNSGAIATEENLGVNQRNKHIDLKYHFVRDCYEKGKTQLTKWST